MENWTIKPTIGSTVCSLNTDLSLWRDHTATPTHYSENTQIKLPQHNTTTAKTGKYTYGFKTQVKNNKNGFCKVMKQKCYSIHYNIVFDCSECHLYSSMDLLIIKKVQLVLVCGAAPPFDTLNTYIFLSRFGASCLHSFDSQPVKHLGGAEVLPKHNTWVSISLKKSTVHEVTKVLQAHFHHAQLQWLYVFVLVLFAVVTKHTSTRDVFPNRDKEPLIYSASTLGLEMWGWLTDGSLRY